MRQKQLAFSMKEELYPTTGSSDNKLASFHLGVTSNLGRARRPKDNASFVIGQTDDQDSILASAILVSEIVKPISVSGR